MGAWEMKGDELRLVSFFFSRSSAAASVALLPTGNSATSRIITRIERNIVFNVFLLSALLCRIERRRASLGGLIII
jgi:hypothetical protein